MKFEQNFPYLFICNQNIDISLNLENISPCFVFYLNKKYTDQIQDNRRKNNQGKNKMLFYVAFARVAARLPT